MREFTLDDLLNELTQTGNSGPLRKIMDMVPGSEAIVLNEDAEGDMRRLRGVINSMTPTERRNAAKLIDTSRRQRIAAGAGVEPKQVKELVVQFDALSAILKQLSDLRTDRR